MRRRARDPRWNVVLAWAMAGSWAAVVIFHETSKAH